MRSLAITLFLALSAVSSVSASDLDIFIAIAKRQTVTLSTGGTTSSTVDTSSVETSSADTSSASASVTTVSPTSVSSSTIFVTSTSTNTPTPTSTPSASPSTSFVVSTSSVVAPTTSAQPSTTVLTTAFQTSSFSQFVTTVTSITDGNVIQSVLTSSSVVPFTTTAKITSTSTPGINGESSPSSSSGLSSSSKKTIIGVVVGIGGAILIGALGFVAWRIWGRKKQNEDEDDIYDPNENKERPSGSTGDTPFKTTLDQYHNPGPVNTSSNF